jgi:hypothetical protein
MAIGISPDAKGQILSLTEFYFKRHRPDEIDELQRNIGFVTNPLNLLRSTWGLNLAPRPHWSPSFTRQRDSNGKPRTFGHTNGEGRVNIKSMHGR